MQRTSIAKPPSMPKNPEAQAIKEEASQLAAARNFAGATKLYEKAIELDPDDLDSYLTLSAVLNDMHKHDLARHVLRNGLERRPYTVLSFDGEPEATILKITGVQNCLLRTRPNGRYVEGGHFTTKYLIDRGKYRIINFHVLDENIVTYDAFPKFDIILNSIADPDKEEESLKATAEFRKRFPDIPIINDPAAVTLTTRDKNFERLKDVPGVVMPKTIRVSTAMTSPNDLLEQIEREEFEYPILLREPGKHTGKTLEKVNTDTEVKEYLSNYNPDEVYISQFVDSSMKGVSIFTRFFDYHRKMRILCIDGEIYPIVCHIDRSWNVHRPRGHETGLMIRHRWMREEEFIFVSDYKLYIGSDAAKTLRAVCDRIELEFFGIDFNVLPDGRVLIFELNPAMRHSFAHGETFKYVMPQLEAVTEAFNRMISRKIAERR